MALLLSEPESAPRPNEAGMIAEVLHHRLPHKHKLTDALADVQKHPTELHRQMQLELWSC